jgi:hypothetical protein
MEKSVKSDSDILFEELEETLNLNIDQHYFGDTKDFKSLTEVLEILGIYLFIYLFIYIYLFTNLLLSI